MPLYDNVDDLAQDRSDSISNLLELLQSYAILLNDTLINE